MNIANSPSLPKGSGRKMWGLGVGGERLLISLTGDTIRKACSKKPKKPLAARWNRRKKKKAASNETHLGVKIAIYPLGCSHHPASPSPQSSRCIRTVGFFAPWSLSALLWALLGHSPLWAPEPHVLERACGSTRRPRLRKSPSSLHFFSQAVALE